MNVGKIYDIINEFAPFETALDYDNVGIMIGSRETEVRKILVSLDCSMAVAEEAKDIGAELIVTHHPLIFRPLYRVDSDSAEAFLLRNSLSLISAHTNIDLSPLGTGQYLAEVLGLKGITAAGDILIGELPEEMTADEFLGLVKKNLSCEKIRYTDGKALLKKIALCPGSGGEFWDEARAAGADAYLTGDVKHNFFISAADRKFMLIDAGHYETEKIYITRFADILREKTDCEITVSKAEKRPFNIR